MVTVPAHPASTIQPTETMAVPNNKLFGIEACRGIAATMVVLYHAARHADKAIGAPLLGALFQFGHAGVDLFFVISGFIILFVHYDDVGRPDRLAHYAGRRFTRLMPVYWVALLAYISMTIAGGHGAPSLPATAMSVTLLPSNHPPLYDIAWTLQYEVLFYALFGVLVFHRAVGAVALTAWFGLAVFLSPVLHGDSWLPIQFYDPFVLEFGMGMGVAHLLRTRRLPAPLLCAAAGTLLFATTAGWEDMQWLNGYGTAARFGYGIPSAMIVAGIAEADRQRRLVVPGLLRTAGGASYSIYLWHPIFIGLVWRLQQSLGLGQAFSGYLEVPALALVAVVGGIGASRWIEYPVMRRVRALA